MSQIEHADFTPAAPNFKKLVLLSFQGLTNFPYIEEDFDALTNYGLLSKVIEYLNEVIANNNEQNSLMTALYNAYVSLQDYVNDYFDNLDVQEEINNKLDDMAQDGSLYNIIKTYTDPIVEEQNNRIDEINAKVNSATSGSPKGVYATVSDLETADPNHNYIYVVTATGNWYYYNGSAWVSGGTYQSTKISDGEVNEEHLNKSINTHINNKIELLAKSVNISNGATSDDNRTYINNPIYLTTGKKIKLEYSSFIINRYAKYQDYNISTSTFISGSTVFSQEFVVPSDGYYVFQFTINDGTTTSNLININTDYFKNKLLEEIIIEEDLKELYDFKENINNLFAPDLNWLYGTGIGGTGLYIIGTNNNISSGKLLKTNFNTIKMTPKSGYQVNYALFDGNTFISRGTWSTSSITINNNYDVILLGASLESGTGDEETTLNNIELVIDNNNYLDYAIKEIEDLKNTNISLLNNIVGCDFNGSNVHISIDDVNTCLFDLIENEDNYTSIFNNTFLNALRTIHNNYGLVFTLNCFNENLSTGYDISNVPNKWATEWQNNSNWLKLSFHAKQDGTNYNTDTTLNTDYTKFINAVYDFTGSYNCIDTIVRLGYFGGTLNQIKSYTGNKAIRGLLCADDTRISYYFDSTINNYINNNGKYYDLINGYLCFKTLPRLDSNNTETIKNIIENNPKYNKYVEIFFHEYTYYSDSSRINVLLNELGTYFKNNKYNNKFLEDIFKF